MNYMKKSGQLHAPVALLFDRSFGYPLEKRLDEFKSRSGGCGKENILLPLRGNLTPAFQIVPHTRPTELSPAAKCCRLQKVLLNKHLS
jgi:hypothetical protein